MYLAIDLGGTKTLIGLLDDSGTIVNSIKFPTPTDYNQFLAELKVNVESLIDGQNIVAGCMAVPGRIDREKGEIIKLGNLEWQENLKIVEDLKNILNIDLVIENDANLAGLSEAIQSGNNGKVQYITVSTGIGGTYVVKGKLDPNLIDAEIGHMVYEFEGKITEWEDMASGKWLVGRFGKKASELEDQDAWRLFSKNLAIGIVNVCSAVTPDLIIIGGGVGSHLEKFEIILNEEIEKIDPKFRRIPKIIKAQKPEEAVIYGCYQLIKQ